MPNMRLDVPPAKLLPELLDEIAKNEPKRIWAEVPLDDDELSRGFRTITFETLAHAINALCHLLLPKIGTSTAFRVILYLGPADPSWTIVMLALQKLGYTLLCSTPQHSLDMLVDLMDSMECHAILTVPGHMDMWPIIERRKSLDCHEIPKLQSLLDLLVATNIEPFPYTKSYNDQTKMEPLVVLETSGSSSPPKLVVIRNEYPIRAWRQCFHGAHEGIIPVQQKLSESARWYISFPPWHVTSLIIFGVSTCIYGRMTCVFGSARFAPMGEIALELLKSAKISGILAPPSILEEIYALKSGIDCLRQLDMIGITGGSLDFAVGSAISSTTHLFSVLYTTEAGMLAAQYLHDDSSSWNYTLLHPDCHGFELREVDDSPHAELVLLRSMDFTELAPVFATYRHLKEWPTKDLYSQHSDPAKRHLWKHEGRIDDLIILANGQKFNPSPYEEIIRTNRFVKEALVIGDQKPKLALLVQLDHNTMSFARGGLLEAMECVEESMAEANKIAPKDGHVDKSMVVFADSRKEFRRTSRGNVQRTLTLEGYAVEIDRLYKTRGLN